jgi:regulator of replication initiation timing
MRRWFSFDKSKTRSIDENRNSTDRIVTAALLGTAVVIVVQLLGLDELDTWLKISLGAFAIAIPMLVACFVVDQFELSAKYTLVQHSWLSFIAWVAATFGIITIFNHFHPIFGLIASVVGGLCIKYVTDYGDELRDWLRRDVTRLEWERDQLQQQFRQLEEQQQQVKKELEQARRQRQYIQEELRQVQLERRQVEEELGRVEIEQQQLKERHIGAFALETAVNIDKTDNSKGA